MLRAKKELGIFGALLAGVLAEAMLEVLYVVTMGAFLPLTGIPTPGGAPLSIHVLNMGIKGAWSALAYALVMRWSFGLVKWGRLVALWVLGLAVVAVLGGLAMQGTLAPNLAGHVGQIAYLVIGQFIVRDWVSR